MPEEEEAIKTFGAGAEVYRCERCHTSIGPSPRTTPRRGKKFQTRDVNVLGEFSARK